MNKLIESAFQMGQRFLHSMLQPLPIHKARFIKAGAIALATAFLATHGSLVSAATVFDNGNATNLVSDPDNWDNGLPVGQQGTININATANSTLELVGYDVIQTGGVFSHTGINAVTLNGTTTWEINGASASTNTSFRGFNVRGGSSFTVEAGTVNTTAGRDWAIIDAGSSITINGGTVNFGRSVLVQGTAGALFTMNGGSATGTDIIGGPNFADNSKTLNFNGGTTTFGTLDVRGDNTFFNLGGSSAGSLTATALTGGTFGANSSFNWLPGTQMTMRLSTVDEWAATYWGSNRLLFNGQSSAALGGRSWADASNPSIGLGGGSYWSYNSSTETLSVIAVPEPASLAAVGIVSLYVLARVRRRRQKA